MLMKQIGFAVNETNKTLLSQALRIMECRREEKRQNRDKVHKKCKYFSSIKQETKALVEHALTLLYIGTNKSWTCLSVT